MVKSAFKSVILAGFLVTGCKSEIPTAKEATCNSHGRAVAWRITRADTAAHYDSGPIVLHTAYLFLNGKPLKETISIPTDTVSDAGRQAIAEVFCDTGDINAARKKAAEKVYGITGSSFTLRARR